MGGVVYCVACGRRFQTPLASAPQPPAMEQYASHQNREGDKPPTGQTAGIIWRGRPSRWKQTGWYLLSGLLIGTGGLSAVWSWSRGIPSTYAWMAAGVPYGSALLVITGFMAAALAEIRRFRYYYVIGKTELTASRGLLNFELSRILVRDIRSLNLRAQFQERLVGICDVEIGTAGTSGVEMTLIAIPRRVGEALRHTGNL